MLGTAAILSFIFLPLVFTLSLPVLVGISAILGATALGFSIASIATAVSTSRNNNKVDARDKANEVLRIQGIVEEDVAKKNKKLKQIDARLIAEQQAKSTTEKALESLRTEQIEIEQLKQVKENIKNINSKLDNYGIKWNDLVIKYKNNFNNEEIQDIIEKLQECVKTIKEDLPLIKDNLNDQNKLLDEPYIRAHYNNDDIIKNQNFITEIELFYPKMDSFIEKIKTAYTIGNALNSNRILESDYIAEQQAQSIAEKAAKKATKETAVAKLIAKQEAKSTLQDAFSLGR